jgi:peptidyl-prolyl cis-trans isomerase SurA
MTALAVAAALGLAATAVPAYAQHKSSPAGQTLASTIPPAANTPTGVNEAAIVEHAPGDAVAAIVNESPISDYDVRQRVALFVATSGMHPSDEVLKQIRGEVLKQLETERLELLEAQKNNTSVSSSDVDKAIDDIMKDNHMTMDQLKGTLASANVQMATLRSQIAASIAWSKVVQDQLGDRVHVSKENVAAELARIKAGATKPRFLVSEIFLTVDTPEQDAKVLKDMQDMSNQIALGAPFSSVARQFSQNPTAAQGGDAGWVQEGQLPPELDSALQKLHVGDVSQPVRSAGGYFLLLLRDRQEPAGTKIPDASTLPSAYPPGVLPLQRILLPIGPKPPKELLDRALQAAAIIRTHINGCEHLQDVVKRMPGAVPSDLGLMHLNELSAEIQGALAKTSAGESTAPFESAAGIEIIVRCDKAPPKITAIPIPTSEQVENSLYQDQISTLARQYLRDLRRDADIETR